MKIFKLGKKKKKKERVNIDVEKININEEAYFRIQATKDGDDVVFSTDIAGRTDLIINVMLQWSDQDPEFAPLLQMLTDNVTIRKIAKMTGKTEDEVATEMREQAEAARIKAFMGQGGTEA